MLAKSKAQQKAAGAALSAKRGQTKPGALRGASRQMFETMDESELDSLATTERKGMPEHVEEDRAEKTSAKRSAARVLKSRARSATKAISQRRTKKAAQKLKRAKAPKNAPARKRPTQ